MNIKTRNEKYYKFMKKYWYGKTLNKALKCKTLNEKQVYEKVLNENITLNDKHWM